MGPIQTRDVVNIFKSNALQPNINGVSCTGFNSTVRDIGSGQIIYLGASFHNNNATAAWIQIFFIPANQVVLGVTPPDMTMKIGGLESVSVRDLDPIRYGSGFSIAATTSETGSTGVSSDVTGSVFYR